MANIIIMFPNNSTSVLLGKSFIGEVEKLSFFIPEGVHEQGAGTCLLDVMIAASGLDVVVDKTDNYNLENFNFVVFPSLDVQPKKSRVDFAAMCKNLFR